MTRTKREENGFEDREKAGKMMTKVGSFIKKSSEILWSIADFHRSETDYRGKEEKRRKKNEIAAISPRNPSRRKKKKKKEEKGEKSETTGYRLPRDFN